MFLWEFSCVEVVPERQIRLTYQKFRNRLFVMPKSHFEQGACVDPPKGPSLYHTADFFMKLLSAADYQRLRATVMALDGCSIRVGTTCSGSDIGITAVKSLLLEINRTFNVIWL